MASFRIGDIVARKSYKGDLIFKIINIRENDKGQIVASLKGLDYRLEADAPMEDLQPISIEDIKKERQKLVASHVSCFENVFFRSKKKVFDLIKKDTKKEDKKGYFQITGKVLHLDGDEDYLNLCMNTYKQLGIDATGFTVPEEKQPEILWSLLQIYRPDILILTGHDGILKNKEDYRSLDSYRTSKYFVEGVKIARQFQQSKDELIIFAGACQSLYEEIIKAGANFASSPERVLIHAFDPVFVVERVLFTSFAETATIEEVIANTITGREGIGGIESKGKLRLGLPKVDF